MLKSKIKRETLKAKGYRLYVVETGKVTVGQDSRRLLEKLADDKLVISNIGKDKPEVTIMKREETQDGSSKRARERENKEVVRSVAERIPEDILRRAKLRRKRVSFKEEVEHLGLDQESGEWQPPEMDGEEKICP